ncbi:hypothetical protein LOTGIDRAFT_126688 [Lottia gigantea]|uniref:Probable proline--tRNA ligase, mitochondrial n=1 Tax=Lottia gigantea TaxID=225164 RepID=V4A4J6_LOTGI|nr:hypothetical protein LOTGIDRAFT_126688 [Lottia gigantea]ESO88186.1 hypothetical protein LOTGIDRAFT_126688 [Lottia gigantea]
MSNSRRFVSKLFQNFGRVEPEGSSQTCQSQILMQYNDIVESCHSGCYVMLPFGQRALDKLVRVVDEEMQAIGGQKISLPTLAPAKLWKKSERWDDALNELFTLKDRHNVQYCLGPTHEELVTNLMAMYSPISEKRLPIKFYQITRKFRDEMKPKHLLLRGREFEMKDMYSFDASESEARETYDIVCESYSRLFSRLELPFAKVEGATGNIGGSISHEFHLMSSVGEDKLLFCEKCSFRSNSELVKDQSTVCPTCDADCQLRTSPGIEIGHTFLLGTKYSSVFKSTCMKSDRGIDLTHMGCYGIGVSRLLQGSVEVLSSENKIRWPRLIAPYQICILPHKGIKAAAEQYLATSLTLSDALNVMPNLKHEVVIDDRQQISLGKRLFDAKRLGYPYIIVVGKRIQENPPIFEIIETSTNESHFLSIDSLKDFLSTVETI